MVRLWAVTSARQNVFLSAVSGLLATCKLYMPLNVCAMCSLILAPLALVLCDTEPPCMLGMDVR
jgi:hypothetical protein